MPEIENVPTEEEKYSMFLKGYKQGRKDKKKIFGIEGEDLSEEELKKQYLKYDTADEEKMRKLIEELIEKLSDDQLKYFFIQISLLKRQNLSHFVFDNQSTDILAASDWRDWDICKETEFEKHLAKLEKQLLKKAASGQSIKATGKKVINVTYPLDKVNNKAWNLFDLEPGNINRQPLRVEKAGANKPINIYYSINFDGLEPAMTIAKKLQPYDKRVYVAAAALYNESGEDRPVVTLNQIYHAMGFTGEPGKADKEKINNSITKMRAAQIVVDNTEEVTVGKYKYDKFVYDGSLLPTDRVTAIAKNGQEIDSSIRLLAEPPLITFARGRNQITELKIKILQSPISKTDLNLQVEDYLLDRIARAKTGRGTPKILYKTIIEQLHSQNMLAASVRQLKSRLPDKVKKYLDYYIKCGHIKKYTSCNEGVTVYF